LRRQTFHLRLCEVIFRLYNYPNGNRKLAEHILCAQN
jgi:hypothetical protein